VTPVARRLRTQFDRFLPLVKQAIQQAQRRVLDGHPVASREKMLSLFEPHTRVARRGKTGTAAECGRQAAPDEVGLERDVGWGVLAIDLRHLAIAQAQRQLFASQ